jgi:hypothetical protein
LTIKDWRIHKIQETTARVALEAYLHTHNYQIIGYFNPNLISYSLYFGDMWSGKRLKNILGHYYPDSIFFDTGAARFYTFGNKTIEESELTKKLANNRHWILKGTSQNLETLNSLPFDLHKRTIDNGITISGQYYEATLKNRPTAAQKT